MNEQLLKNIIINIINRYPESGEKSAADILDTLIATKLSQNTTDKASFVAYNNLKKRFKTWENVSKAKLSEIKKEIQICGLANTKAAQIKNMLNLMKHNYGELNLDFMKKMDNEEIYAELLKYKGIGYKTISCVLVFSLGRSVFPVDTHIHRVLNRIGVLKTKTPDETFWEASKIIPDKFKMKLHTAIIKFGREICKALNPVCSSCMITKYCRYPEKNFSVRTFPKKNDFIILENI